jgi:hypothetical protein
MKFKVDLHLNWKKLLVTPKDMILLSEILDRAVLVDESYSEESSYHLIKHTRNPMHIEEENREPITYEQFEAILAAEKAAKGEVNLPKEHEA